MAGKDGALDRARDIYGDRSRRARQLQAEGKRVIGYPCVYVPTELLTASDLVPYRVYADIGEPVTEADRALPTSFCSIMRGCFDCALKGRDGFLDGVVVAHSCDPQEKTARLWESYIDYPFSHFMDIPGTVRPEAVEYFKGQMQDLVRALEAFTGQRLSKSALRGAVQLHNRQRALVRELYDLTKPDPPALSGVEVLQVVKALMSIPVAEGNDLLEQVIAEAK
ncbi:MAG: 2-hydroxyacyl-CoA dehydratase family protein, partial [Chloroflexota bacterium]|nr:2-hydroxyacyl-CoA dehydratase family protein [Chloroflexota bacterium]